MKIIEALEYLAENCHDYESGSNYLKSMSKYCLASIIYKNYSINCFIKK